MGSRSHHIYTYPHAYTDNKKTLTKYWILVNIELMNNDTPRTHSESFRIQYDISSMRLDDWHAAYKERRIHAETLERELNAINAEPIEPNKDSMDYGDLLALYGEQMARCFERAEELDAALQQIPKTNEKEDTYKRLSIKAGVWRSLGNDMKNTLKLHLG